MLRTDIIALCFEVYTQHRNAFCGQNLRFYMLRLVVHVKVLISRTRYRP